MKIKVRLTIIPLIIFLFSMLNHHTGMIHSLAQESITIQEESSIVGKVLESEKQVLECGDGSSIPISIFYFESTSDEGSGSLIGNWKMVPGDEKKVASGQIVGGTIEDNSYQLQSVVEKGSKFLCPSDVDGKTSVTLTGQCGTNGNIIYKSGSGSQYNATGSIECTPP